MKTIYLFLLATAFLFSCKKYKAEQNLSEQMIGTWEIEAFYGFPENRFYPEDNGQTISFSRGFVFLRKAHDTLLFKGTYFLETKKDCHQSETDIRLKTSEHEAAYYYVKMKDGKLWLSTPTCYADGGTSVWRKL